MKGRIMIDHHPRPQNIEELGSLIKARRLSHDMSFRELSDITGIEKSNLHRLESGQIKKPRPAHLNALADALDISIADLYGYAGLPLISTLPTFAPYLRTKYGELPEDAQKELEIAFARVTAKYGFKPEGPARGEDE